MESKPVLQGKKYPTGKERQISMEIPGTTTPNWTLNGGYWYPGAMGVCI